MPRFLASMSHSCCAHIHINNVKFAAATFSNMMYEYVLAAQCDPYTKECTRYMPALIVVLIYKPIAQLLSLAYIYYTLLCIDISAYKAFW